MAPIFLVVAVAQASRARSSEGYGSLPGSHLTFLRIAVLRAVVPSSGSELSPVRWRIICGPRSAAPRSKEVRAMPRRDSSVRYPAWLGVVEP
jgi:hypothetical protein